MYTNMVTRSCNGKLLHYICLLVDYDQKTWKAESDRVPLDSNLDIELPNNFINHTKDRYTHTPPKKTK